MKKIGITLSGGGARGVAHLGILQVLEEMGMKPQILSGVSAGGMVGGFYTAGYSPKEILGFMKHVSLFSLFNPFHGSILSMNIFKEIYKERIPHNSFDHLEIPLHIAATDILKGETVYFSSGPLDIALLATSCVPVAFETVIYEGLELVDGGVLNNMPIEPLIGKCDALIGIYVNSIDDTIDHIHTKDLADRSFHLAIRADMEAKGRQCDLFLQPPAMSRFGIFDIGDADAIYQAGYDYATAEKERIEAFQKNL
jgi:NTE family protein